MCWTFDGQIAECRLAENIKYPLGTNFRSFSSWNKPNCAEPDLQVGRMTKRFASGRIRCTRRFRNPDYLIYWLISWLASLTKASWIERINRNLNLFIDIVSVLCSCQLIIRQLLKPNRTSTKVWLVLFHSCQKCHNTRTFWSRFQSYNQV